MNAPVQFGDMQAALGFVTSQQTHIETGVLEKPYPMVRYSELIPVDTSANPFAASVTFFSQDGTGKAGFINGKGDDVPLVDILRTKFEQGVNMAGIGYSFSLEEIGQAQMLGQSLEASGAEAARLAYEQLVDEVAFVGDTQLGVEGLFNMTGITSAAAGKTFATSTPQEILSEINTALTAVLTTTQGVEMADTVIVPLAEYGRMATTQLSPESDVTVLNFIQRANVYTAQTGQPLTILGDRRLTDKAVMYRRDPLVLKMHMPMPLRFIPPQAEGLKVSVYGMFRFAPVNIRRPGAVRYLTGLA